MAIQGATLPGIEPPESTSEPTAITSRSQSPHVTSAVSSPISDDSPKVEWHVCPHCQTAKRTNSKKTVQKSDTSNSTSPTTSDASQAQSSFARFGYKIKDIFGHSSESASPSTVLEKSKAIKKKPSKKKPTKPKVVTYDKGYEEIGGDHWADDY